MRERLGASALCLLLLFGCAGPSLAGEQPQNGGGPAATASLPEEPTPAAPQPEQQWLQNQYIQSLVEQTVAELPPAGAGDAERVRAAYEHIVSTVTFTEPLGLDCWRYRGEQTEPAPPYLENRALSPLAFGAGWCEDSAAALTLLLQAIGLRASYLPGMTVSAERTYVDHAWVVVELGGRWHHIDPQLERDVLQGNRLTYRYFLKSDAEMRADHLWGEGWIAYGKSGEEALTQAQIDEIRALYIPPACPDAYPAPAPHDITLAPPPRPAEIRAQLAQERRRFEEQHGPLAPLALHLTPPVFGEVEAPFWEDNVAVAVRQPSAAVGAFFRSGLTADEVALYDALERAASDYRIGQPISVPTPLSRTRFLAVCADWQNDRPQHYWATPSPAMNTRGEVASFTLTADALTPETLRARQQEVDAAASALLKGLPDDEFERLLALHDRLLNATYYPRSPGGADTDNLYGALVRGRAICDGLSRAFQYLAHLGGLECIYVYGTTAWGTTHTWNAVRLDGEWYYVDVTWDLNRGATQPLHAYLMASWEEISKEHIPHPDLAGRLPMRTGTGDYYTRRGYAAHEPRDNPALLAEAFVAQLNDQTFPERRQQAYVEIKVLAQEDSYRVTKEYVLGNMVSVIACINDLAQARDLSWRVDATAGAVVNHDDPSQVLTAFLYVKRTM